MNYTGYKWYVGVPHCHTVASDGGLTLEQVIEKAKKNKLDKKARKQRRKRIGRIIKFVIFLAIVAAAVYFGYQYKDTLLGYWETFMGFINSIGEMISNFQQ